MSLLSVDALLRDKHILFVMHTRITHFLTVFRDFTAPKCRSYHIIDHPLHPLKGTESKYMVYHKKNLVKKRSFPRISGPYTFNFFKDFFLTILWGLSAGVVYDVGIGANNLNTLSLLVLRRLGRIRNVIFMCIDYSPNRYDNTLLDWVYHWIDRMCCYHADVIWNSSGRMNEARVKNGVNRKRIAHTIVMPDGSNFDQKRRLPVERIDRNLIIYSGHMRPVMGVPLILDAYRELLHTVPSAKLILTGDGPDLEKYKEHARLLGLEKKAVFTGYLKTHEEVDEILRIGAIGLALFAPDKSSYEYYSDVGKPKAYLAAGMPVIITRVPEIADTIEQSKAGIVIEYRKVDLVNALIRLLKNDQVYREYRKNAIVLSKKYVWSTIFRSTWWETLDYLNSL